MKNTIVTIIFALVILTLAFFSIYLGRSGLSSLQLKTLNILIIVCLSSVLYCFIVGEISRNNSQMDKIWSILPIAYVWIITISGGFKLRLVMFALIVTLWGIRLTFNFARKGAYSIKFWSGEEDYRWKILRGKKPFTNKLVWALFDLFFISFYQNVLVLAITLPLLAVMESNAPLNWMDAIVVLSATIFLAIEHFADEEQWYFQRAKKEKLKNASSLEEIDYPFNLGFNTIGLWSRFRHPNYLGEQGMWFSLYFFVVSANVASFGIFNWSFLGALFLILLFMGSSALGEKISSSKYPKYQLYQKQVFKYLPFKQFQGE